jgi:hypothetical protein
LRKVIPQLRFRKGLSLPVPPRLAKAISEVLLKMKRATIAFTVVIGCLVGVGHVHSGGSSYLIKKEDIPDTIKALKSGSSVQRLNAVNAIGKHGAIRISDIRDAIDPLKTLLQTDKDAAVKAAAARALGLIAPEPKETVKLLIKALDEKDPAVKLAAIDAIGRMGTAAVAARTQLREIAQDKDNKALSKKARTVLKSIQGN